MEKENKKRIQSLFLNLFLFILLMFSTQVNALEAYSTYNDLNTVVYNANDWTQFKNRTKKEIREKYDLVKTKAPTYVDGEESTYYDVPASINNPYYQGVVSQDTINIMTAETNFYRWLMGYSELRSVNTNSDSLQIQALARQYEINRGHVLHDENKPADFPADLWELARPINHNILAYYASPRRAVSAWLSEGYNLSTSTFDTIGHRVALIDPLVVNVDFGYSGTTAIGLMHTDSNANTNVAYGAFPNPGYAPLNNIYISESSWSVKLNPDTLIVNDENSLVVKVTNLKTNQSYDCTIAKGNLEYSDPMYTGDYLIFEQPKPEDRNYYWWETYNEGDKFKVEVTGLTDKSTSKAAKLVYTTEFFDLNSIDVNPNKVVSKIDVISNPNKTSYLLSEFDTDDPENKIDLVDLTGGKVKVTFDDNSTKELDLKDVNVELIDDYPGIDNKLRITYNEDNKNVEAFIKLLILDDFQFSNTSGYYSSATYGDKLSSIILPDEWFGKYEWVEGNNTLVGDSDKSGFAIRNHELKFVPDDSQYNELTLSVPIRVAQADFKFVVPTNLKAYAGTKAENIILPQGFELEDESCSLIINEGNNKLYVKYIPIDSNNYKETRHIEINVEGIKNALNFETPTGLTATYGNTLYDVESQLNAFNTSDGAFSFKDDLDTLVGDAGENEFTVIYTPTDSKYSAVEVKVKIKVNKAMASDVIIPYVSTITYNPNKTLGDVKLPSGWNWADETIVPTVNNSGYDIVYTPSEENLKNYDYSNVQLTKHIVVNVEKADPTYTIPTGIKAYKDMTLADVELPSGFTWKDSTINVGNTGEHEFLATYTPSDLDNYNIIENIKIKVNVGKAKPSFTVPTDLVATYGDTLADITLPSADNGTFSFAKDASTSVGNAGDNEFTLIFTPNDLDNYDVVETKVIIKVNKADGGVINPPVVSPITYNPNTKLENIPLSEGWVWDNKTIVPTVNNHGYAATYKNADLDNYYYQGDATAVVNLVVNKARPNIPSKLSLIGYKTMTLASVVLPESEDGVYSWNSDVDTELVLGTMTFSAKFTPNDLDNYEVIDNIEVVVDVSKMRPTYTIPTDLVATYGDTLESISLPQGFTWNNPTDLVGNAGDNKFFVTYTPDDTDNYAIVSDIPVIVKVNKKVADLVTIPTVDTEYVYSPNNTLGDIQLGDGWTWDDPSIVPTVGNSGYKATYTPVDSNNYDYSNQDLNPTILVNVVKGTYDYEIPTYIWAYWGDTLEDVYLPLGFTFQDSLDTSVGEVGYQEFKVTYTPIDLNNYNISKDIVIKVLVEKKWPEVSPLDEITVDYKDGMTLGNIKLPEGWSWYNSGCSLTETDYYEVVYTPKDTEHYATIYDIVRVVVKKPFNNNASTNKVFYGNGSVYGESSNNNSNSLASSDNDKEIKVDSEDEKDNTDEEDDDSETSSPKFPWWILILVVVIIALVIGYSKYSENK